MPLEVVRENTTKPPQATLQFPPPHDVQDRAPSIRAQRGIPRSGLFHTCPGERFLWIRGWLVAAISTFWRLGCWDQPFFYCPNRNLHSRLDALLLADSGYAPSNPPEWIAKLRPEVILLSVGAKDWDGRPDPETIEAVQGYTLLRTDRSGWIEITTDGERM